MSLRSLQARFEDFDGHRSVVVRWQPARPPAAQVLFVPAFGDEMNQMRRMVALAAEALARRGVASCVFDLYGTGDSSADFADATVEHWLADCRAMVERVRAEAVPLMLIGCRLGAALASRLTYDLPAPVAGLIGWAPVLQGKSQLSGMLRAAAVARSQRPGAGGPDARAIWASGQTAPLAGYPVSSVLAAQLEALDASGAPRAQRSTLFDLRLPIGDDPVSPSEALRKRVAAWSEQGVPSDAVAIAGPAFWNVADLVDVPQLIDQTVAAVMLASRAPA